MLDWLAQNSSEIVYISVVVAQIVNWLPTIIKFIKGRYDSKYSANNAAHDDRGDDRRGRS